MSVEKIIKRINEDVKRKIENIYDRQKKRAEEKRRKIEKDKERELKDIQRKGEREIKIIRDRLISQAKLESRKRRLTVREDIIDEVFQRAKERLKDMEPSEYEVYLRNAIGRSVKSLGSDVTIHCNREDENKVEELVDKISPSVDVRADLDSIGGIKAVSPSGSSINLTFKANLERKRKELRKDIAERMFKEED